MATETQPTLQSALQPLPIPVENNPGLKKLVHCIGVIAVTTNFMATLGVAIALTDVNIKVIVAATAGGVVGLILGVALCILTPYSSAISQYRIRTLEQIKKEVPVRAQESIQVLQTFFKRPFHTLEKERLCAFYQTLTVVTAVIIQAEKNELKKIWRPFLTHLHEVRLVDEKGWVIELDLTMLLNYLDGTEPKLKEPRLLTCVEDENQIRRFGGVLIEGESGKCVVIESELEILGYISSKRGADGNVIIEKPICKPKAAGFSLEKPLVLGLLREYQTDQPVIKVKIDAKDPRAAIYTALKFERNEGSDEMVLNWTVLNRQ